MGFFDKIKAGLNIGGSKLTISGPGTVQNGQNLEFKVMIAGGKLEQSIKDVTVKLVMAEQSKNYNLQGGSSQSIKYITVAQDAKHEGFTIQPGENKEFSFSLPVNVASDGSDQGGMMGNLSKLNNMATGKKRVFKLKASADIEGSTDTGDEMEIAVSM